MNTEREALKELYDLLVEYDLEGDIEDDANDIDSRNGNTMRDEYARVVGIFEGVRVALGISRYSGVLASAAQEATDAH